MSDRDNSCNCININKMLRRIESTLLQAWKETGFGHLEINLERNKQNKIAVTLKCSTSYRYVISDDEVDDFNRRSSF